MYKKITKYLAIILVAIMVCSAISFASANVVVRGTFSDGTLMENTSHTSILGHFMRVAVDTFDANGNLIESYDTYPNGELYRVDNSSFTNESESLINKYPDLWEDGHTFVGADHVSVKAYSEFRDVNLGSNGGNGGGIIYNRGFTELASCNNLKGFVQVEFSDSDPLQNPKASISLN
jgi:hypothetical protein